MFLETDKLDVYADGIFSWRKGTKKKKKNTPIQIHTQSRI